MSQKVKNIKISDLVLWTENPRDPIDESASDQDIIDRALNSSSNKWSFQKLAKEMGDHYDFSELPTVVYKNKKPVVYDGNRRVALGKIKHGLVKVPPNMELKLPEIPHEIPCNICSEAVAIKNIYRKHSNSGSWQPLERDMFLNKFMKEKKTEFLLLDENTGLISNNKELNKVFVRDEIFNKENLLRLGFSFNKDKLYSVHSEVESNKVLEDIIKKITSKVISTRKNRGKVIEVLEPATKKLLDDNRKNKSVPFNISYNQPNLKVSAANATSKKHTPRTRRAEETIFDKKLYLISGDVSDLYRDIVDLYEFYTKNKKTLSKSFPALIRMSLRLLCETASNDKGLKLDAFIKNNFSDAKSKLSKDQKTTLSTQNVDENSSIRLLQAGAHNYTSSNNLAQTLALSIIIGEILTNTHGKDN